MYSNISPSPLYNFPRPCHVKLHLEGATDGIQEFEPASCFAFKIIKIPGPLHRETMEKKSKSAIRAPTRKFHNSRALCTQIQKFLLYFIHWQNTRAAPQLFKLLRLSVYVCESCISITYYDIIILKQVWDIFLTYYISSARSHTNTFLSISKHSCCTLASESSLIIYTCK